MLSLESKLRNINSQKNKKKTKKKQKKKNKKQALLPIEIARIKVRKATSILQNAQKEEKKHSL